MTQAKKKSEHTKTQSSHILYRHKIKEEALGAVADTQSPVQQREKPHIFHLVNEYFNSSFLSFLWLSVLVVFVFGIGLVTDEKRYEGKIYPNVTIDGVAFGGKTESEARTYWENRSRQFTNRLYEFRFETLVASASGEELGIGYDATLLARQAFALGRSENRFTRIAMKFFKRRSNVAADLRFDNGALDDLLLPLADSLKIPVQEALFDFQGGKVAAFKPSNDGRAVDVAETKKRFADLLKTVPDKQNLTISIPLVVKTIKPTITTDRANDFGISELIGHGYSEYQGSIPGRIHNVALATSKFHGVLIKPGEVFSFNDVLGDVSSSTGFAQAYIIKNGRTVLGDGGGVCQVSSTLFRAALAAGLPIVERTAHAYRVHYYEEGGYKPGLDATVFAPTVDLKFKNDTPGYILIQAKIDESVPSLTFDLYGTGDGRKSEIYNQLLWDQTPPPPNLFQDDPTLPVGVVKQVDFAAWGAKASFQYKVTDANGTILQDQTFYSNFRPWQAVFLRGTKQP